MPFKKNDAVSQKQSELFTYLVEFVANNGFQPTIVEMAEHFGVTRKAIRDRLHQLAEKGLIELPGTYRERCIRLNHVKFVAKFIES